MEIIFQNLNQGLNKGYLKQGVTRTEINLFKANLVQMYSRIDEQESEENLKNIVADFLKETYYKNRFEINTKDRKDLVIHHGKSAKDPVGVILEAKKPSNKAEMPNKERQNVKALHELLLYYLREVHENNNHEIKYLVATNIWEWFIFDGVWFEKNVSRNAELKKKYTDWKVSGNSTQHFYDYTAKIFFQKEIDSSTTLTNPEKLPCTYFNLKDFQKLAQNPECEEDNDLISLYKTFSPEHLLRKPFANDSNTLNKEFYFELLYILGLEEVKDGTKKVIVRYAEAKRNEGSLLENTINKLTIGRKFGDKDITDEDTTLQEEIFEVALELCITWINRILFLKLLEGQLVQYHRGNRDFRFLNEEVIRDFDELEELFFEVLAIPVEKRKSIVNQKFGHIPYLNSSLFEYSDLERKYVSISCIKDRLTLPIYVQSVLKDGKGNKISGNKNTLVYLFQFLDSYNFSSDSQAEIQPEDKTIINAAVLGLIFEKINGYKDGSFFTPGYITMYMCRETIRRAAVAKFNEKMGWNCETFSDLQAEIAYKDKKERQKANEIVNSLTVCDPAVGSGHFLVSALNEIIALKSDLRILSYTDGSRITGFSIEIENDELIVTDQETNKLFQYSVGALNKPISDIEILQTTLFHEKQIIIENCLFGVDINPKSVAICRLRLWIELLKHAYYTKESNYQNLETLPNIDINIKVGNSLVSRFHLLDDLSAVFRNKKFNQTAYLLAVNAYKAVKERKVKEDLRRFLAEIKEQFKGTLLNNHPYQKELSRKKGELVVLDFPDLFDGKNMSDTEKDKKKKILQKEITLLEHKVRDYYDTTFYKNALEWRFEFPEVLNENGEFLGFDIVIGNPPYGATMSEKMKEHMKDSFSLVHQRTFDTFNYFIAMGTYLTKYKGYLSFIIPNNLFFQAEFEQTRRFLSGQLLLAYNLGDNVFAEANVPTAIFLSKKEVPDNKKGFIYADYRNEIKNEKFIFDTKKFEFIELLNIENTPSYTFGSSTAEIKLIEKMRKQATTIDEIAEEVASGISTGADKVFRINAETVQEVQLERELLQPVLVGREILKYQINDTKHSIIYTERSTKIKNFVNTLNYLNPFKPTLSKRSETKGGILPWFALNRQRYKGLFTEPKILIRQTSDAIIATFDAQGFFALDSLLICKIEKEKPFDYLYILAVLNSKITHFIYQTFTQEQGRVFAQVKPQNVRKMLIPNISKEAQQPYIEIVTAIMQQKIANKDTSDLERKIDEMLYSFYQLTPQEIAIIEGKN